MSVKKITALLSLTGMITVGIFAGVTLVQQQQLLNKKAATPQGQATIILSPLTGNYEEGDTIPVQVNFNTNDIAISAIAVRLSYKLATSDITPSNIQINPNLLASGDWACPIKNLTEDNARVLIDIACINTSTQGFSTQESTLLVSFNLDIVSAPKDNSLELVIDPGKSIITKKSDGLDTLLSPLSSATYYIFNSDPTQTPTPTPTSTPTSKNNKGVPQKLKSDINEDGVVNHKDFTLMIKLYIKRDDKSIKLRDFITLINEYGKSI